MVTSRRKTAKDYIIEELTQHHALTATQLLENLAAKNKPFNKTSVYRALDDLLDQELICRHFFDSTEAQFELRADHHTHLVCTSCGGIGIAGCKYRQPKEIRGFTVDHHHLTLFGTCQRCQKQS